MRESSLPTGMTRGADVLSSFHDSLQDAVYVFDDADGTLVDANARVGEVSGRATTELLGLTLEALLERWGANDAAAEALAAYGRVANGDRPDARAEFELRNADGDLVHVDARFSRHDGYVVAAVRNLEAIRERERELESVSEQLEVLNRVLRHDIRNDMNVVQGWLDELAVHVDDDGREALSNVRDAVAHTVALTAEARDLAKILTEGGEMPVEPVPLDAVLHRQVEKTRQKYPSATVRVDGHVPPVSVAANQMLSSVFDNLLGNAVVHSDREEPTVTISVDDDPAEAGAIVVRVADDGPGIPDAVRSSLFGRGEKGVESPGTGMGLYLVDRLVDGYGGRVEAADRDPRGTAFVVTLERAGA
jgi:PAS domain S-box-containing protein